MLKGYCLKEARLSTDDSVSDASAMLDVKSTTKGMLVPRLDKTQRAAITILPLDC